MAFEEKTGRKHKMLADTVLPRGLERLWGDFIDLHSSRGSTGMGAARITFADIDAWQRVTGTVLEPWEIDCIRKADDAFLTQQAREAKRER